MDRNSIEFATAAISRIQQGMTGRYSFDAWRHYAIGRWQDLIDEKTAEAAKVCPVFRTIVNGGN